MGTFTISGDVNARAETYTQASGGSSSKGITVIVDDAKVVNQLEFVQVLRSIERNVLSDAVYPPA